MLTNFQILKRCDVTFYKISLSPQRVLPRVAEHLNGIFRNPALGRMSANGLEERVMLLLGVWESWSIYPPLFLAGLEAAFQRRGVDLDAPPRSRVL